MHIPVTKCMRLGSHFMMHDETERLTTATAVAATFNVTRRTISRWMEDDDMSFPKPTVIRNRLYFKIREIEAWKRQRAPQAA